jgi:hypothetical protein
VYKLGKQAPVKQNGVVYYEKQYYSAETNEITSSQLIVDDLRIDKPSLSMRRLQLLRDNAQLYNINYIIYFLADLIKLAKPNQYFIDNNGKFFVYRKTARAKLRFYEIKTVLPITGFGSIIEVHGFAERFKTLYKANPGQKWAGILEYKGINILYGLYYTKHKETWRSI